MTKDRIRRLVRGFWGARPEPVEELGRRWSRTLDAVGALLPEAAAVPDGWTWRTVTAPEAPAGAGIRGGDEAGLVEVLGAAAEREDWSDRTGTGLRLVLQDARPGWGIELSGLAGGRPEVLLQSMVVTVVAPADAAVPDAGLLTALVECWCPDHAEVTDDDVMDALEDTGHIVGEPSVGWLAYLSAGRAALLPADLAVDARDEPGGGVVVRLAPADEPDAVAAAYARLHAAGALRPLPRPLERAVL